MTGACQSLWKIMHAQHLESCLLVKGSCKIKIVQPLINIWLDKLFNLVGNYLWGWTLGSEVYSWQYVPLLTVCPFADSMPLCWQYVQTVSPFIGDLQQRILGTPSGCSSEIKKIPKCVTTNHIDWKIWMGEVNEYSTCIWSSCISHWNLSDR